MRRIKQADIERVRAGTDILALIQSRGIKLSKRPNGNWAGACPFHQEQETASLMVMPELGSFHCQVCKLEGNAIDFIHHHDGVSLWHAFELLDKGGSAAFVAKPLTGQGTVPLLPCPLDSQVDDARLMDQVVAYYQERLKQSASALDFLEYYGLRDDALLDRFQVGYADRSLGLRLPESNRREGEMLRARLVQLGIWRSSGHEHFSGCIVVPLVDSNDQVVSFYGRRVSRGLITQMFAQGSHSGLFNREAFQSDELILCATPFDALSFITKGMTNVSALRVEGGIDDELIQSLKPVKRVKLVYESAEDEQKLKALGIEVWKVRIPPRISIGKYARSNPTALSQAVNGAVWCGKGSHPVTVPAPIERPVEPVVAVEVPVALKAITPAKEQILVPSTPCLEPRGDAWFLTVDNREYRVTGLEKTVGVDHLKVGLRLALGERFHLDQIDLMKDAERRRFIDRAAEETGLSHDLLKRDLGRVLLAVEVEQARMMKPAETMPVAVDLSPEEREAALKWLRDPGLVGRLREAFRLSGIIGEEGNALVAYLACVSRKLERPLAIIIQSASAAGKTTLMDAVLSFFPEEERVKYSAMTGQSLYYLGETNLKHKILAVVEEAGAQKAGYALKLLQSEGELTIASTGKDPDTGRMVTQEYRVEGPVMLFLTTTAIDLDEELQNRCLTLAVDESIEQTARIHQLQRERRTLAGLIAKEERRDVLTLLRNAQRLLSPLEVLNPFAPSLKFPTGRTRNRRDHEKYLTLIDAIALLHQHQRPRGQHMVHDRLVEFIEVTQEDIALAHELAPEVLGQSLDELPSQTRRLLESIRTLVKSRSECESARVAARFSRKEIREATGWSLTQVRCHLQRLVDLEYLIQRGGHAGGPFIYELVVGVDDPGEQTVVGLEMSANLHVRSGVAGFQGVGGGAISGSNPPASTADPSTDCERKPRGGGGGGNANQEPSLPARLL